MRRSNNFDGLRLVGALAVVVGHAFPLVGRPFNAPIVLGYPLQTLGVVVFFAISGYLITDSWTRTRDIVAFAAARCLRIFPALVVTVVLTVLVIGPLTTTSSTSDYLDAPRTLSYLSNIRLEPQYDLPGVFATLPYPVAVNGSLWTLPAEFFCYVLVPVACLVPTRARYVTLGAFLVVSLVLSSGPVDTSPIVYGTRLHDAAGMWVFFAAGALLRVASGRERQLFRPDVAVAVLAAYVVLVAAAPELTTKVSWLALPYVVLTVGTASTPLVRSAARHGDLSYGIYLYAFPVQQLLLWRFGVLPMVVDVTVVAGISAGLALVSWHVVEKPSLHLKDRLVGWRRGRARTADRAAGRHVRPDGADATAVT